MRFSHLLTTLVFYTTLAAAWPWPANLFIRDSSGSLARRDDPPASSSASAAPKSSAAPSTASATASATGKDDSKTDSASASATAAPSSSPSKSNSTSSISIDPQSPAGGVSMLNPPATTTTYYKLGQNITWVWNYTSLLVTPTAVDVLVNCQSLGATYTVATNLTVGNSTASVVWDTAQETGANVPPDTDKYTLMIYDAGNPAGPTATAEPGKLGVFDQFIFAMYTPQSYTALSEGYQCVTCNGALSSAERQAFGVMFTMTIITVLSFTWFAGGFLSV